MATGTSLRGVMTLAAEQRGSGQDGPGRQEEIKDDRGQKNAPLKKRGSHEKNGKIAFGQ